MNVNFGPTSWGIKSQVDSQLNTLTVSDKAVINCVALTADRIRCNNLFLDSLIIPNITVSGILNACSINCDTTMQITAGAAITLAAVTDISLTAAGEVTIEGNNTSPNNSVLLHAPTGDIALDADVGDIFISADTGASQLIQLKSISRYAPGVNAAGIVLGTDDTCDVNVKGHLITSQATPPATTTANYSIVASSTDVAGMIDTTAAAVATVQINFNESYSTAIIHVSVTAMNMAAMAAMAAGYFITPVGSPITAFTITFSVAPARRGCEVFILCHRSRG